eukprot:Seg803.11 transcript_id=Seg803.11/GoldUCD/mRNA.D3Y31 product="WD repeat-containing protein 74" protein_id=Seg803.11/GoldUCD/D3Y31
MEEQDKQRIWVGSELGYLKSINAVSNVTKNYCEEMEGSNGPNRINAACVMKWTNEEETEFILGTANGQIKFFSTEEDKFKERGLSCGKDAITGLAVYGEKIIACDAIGCLSFWEGNEKYFDKKVGDDIQRMKQNLVERNQIATGGKENNLKIFDLENMEKPVFAAKNVRNDFLDLRCPVLVTDMEFMNNDSSRIIVGTGDHLVKIYDPKKQKRPVVEITWEDYPITTMSLAPNGNTIIVGNTVGSMASIDLRTNQKIGGFKGIAGSIRSIQCHQTQDIVAAVGLDRFLRIFDVNTRALKSKIYLKSRLNCVLLSDKNYTGGIFGDTEEEFLAKKAKVTKSDTAADDENDSDLIWGQMEVLDDLKQKRSKKREAKTEAAKEKKKKVE